MLEPFLKTASRKKTVFSYQSNKFPRGSAPFFFSTKDINDANVHHEIPKLPVIDAIVDRTLANKKQLGDLENTAIIGVQHMLETTGTLFKGLIDIGINPKNMYFIGKCYSTSPAVEKEIINLGVNVFPSTPPSKPGEYHESCRKNIEGMWEFFLDKSKNKKITKLIILDEGGRCLETMPRNLFYKYKISGIEQTRGGLYSKVLDTFLFPLIDVASSVVKKQIEPPLIAEAIQKELAILFQTNPSLIDDPVRREAAKLLQNVSLSENPIFGVIGNGAIGKGIVKYLLSCGYIVNVYDEDVNSFKGINDLEFYRCSDIKTLITNSDCIFGCTGKDITSGIDIFDIIQRDKVFVSCSSEDKEFLSALKEIGEKIKKIAIIYIHPLSNFAGLTNLGDKKIYFLRGGFPINFNKEPYSVPSNDIEVIRGLLFGSCIQAILSASSLIIDGFNTNSLSLRKLDPYLQHFVLNHWIQRQPEGRYSEEHIKQFESIDWINENSGGEYVENAFMKDSFFEDKNYIQTPALRSKL